MHWGWLSGAILVWLMSLICIIFTMYEVMTGKNKRKTDFWGGVAFHAVTAILAIWLLLKAFRAI